MKKSVLYEPKPGGTVIDYIKFMTKVYRYTLEPVEGMFNGTPVFLNGDTQADCDSAYSNWHEMRNLSTGGRSQKEQ